MHNQRCLFTLMIDLDCTHYLNLLHEIYFFPLSFADGLPTTSTSFLKYDCILYPSQMVYQLPKPP